MPPHQWIGGDERRTMYVQRPVRVYDARQMKPSASLDTNGFTLVSAESRVSDFSDQDEVRGVFYDECASVIKSLTGCTSVRVTQHQYRNGYAGLPEGHPLGHKPTPNGSEGSYSGIHSDVTPYSEPGWKNLVDGRHFQVFNLWRTTDHREPIQRMPLSLCDMSSVDPSDMICADSWSQNSRPMKLVSYRLAHNDRQRWYYYPAMSPRELLVFKQYDSMQEQANLRCVYHGAVEDPNMDPDAPLRSTIEVRLLALYDREPDKVGRVKRFQREIPKSDSRGEVSEWTVTYAE